MTTLLTTQVVCAIIVSISIIGATYIIVSGKVLRDKK